VYVFFIFYIISLFVLRVLRNILPFPTRRSSDLLHQGRGQGWADGRATDGDRGRGRARARVPRTDAGTRGGGAEGEAGMEARTGRSEEHTSELQSRENLVCRLLLEKKKNN